MVSGLALLGSAMGVIFSYLGMAMNFVINLGNVGRAPAIKDIWTVSRDIANLFFGLAMIWIALASILEPFGALSGYGWKKALPRLIIAAVLINFSFVIAVTILDVGNLFTSFFLQQIQGEQLSENIANAMRVQALYQANAAQGAPAAAENAAMLLLSGIAMVVMIAVGVIVFAAGLIFLLIRIAYLWALIALSPLIWIAWIFPATQKFWDQWWQLFTKWVFFAPVYVFLLWMALFVVQGGGKSAGNDALVQMLATDNPQALELISQQKTVAGGTDAVQPMYILNFAFFTFMLFFALYGAQAFSIQGAGTAMTMAQNAAKRFSGYSLGKRAGTKTYEYGAKKAAEGARHVAAFGAAGAGRLARSGLLRRIPGVAQAGRNLGAYADKNWITGEQKRKEKVEEAEKLLGGMSSDYLANYHKTLNKEQQIAAMRILAQRGSDDFKKLEDLYKDATGNYTRAFQDIVRLATQYKKEKEVVKVAPELAQYTGKEVKPEDQKKYLDPLTRQVHTEENQEVLLRQVLEKITPAEAAKMHDATFDHQRTRDYMIENFKLGHIQQIATENPGNADKLLTEFRNKTSRENLDRIIQNFNIQGNTQAERNLRAAIIATGNAGLVRSALTNQGIEAGLAFGADVSGLRNDEINDIVSQETRGQAIKKANLGRSDFQPSPGYQAGEQIFTPIDNWGPGQGPQPPPNP
ncbi:MAG: hypothetical protein Q8R13_05355 [bacterium]|nr:hypothetical protein [bacterium]